MVMVADEDLSDITIADQVAEVKRELAMRERVYPKWVLAKKMSHEAAHRDMRRLRAVLKTLLAIQGAL